MDDIEKIIEIVEENSNLKKRVNNLKEKINKLKDKNSVTLTVNVYRHENGGISSYEYVTTSDNKPIEEIFKKHFFSVEKLKRKIEQLEAENELYREIKNNIQDIKLIVNKI